MRLKWDQTGERFFETGVDRGVLYILNEGIYDSGFVWNGLVSLNQNRSGVEVTPFYVDGIKYLNLISLEEFEATIKAFTYPDEFAQFDGVEEMYEGLYINQQRRKTGFGLAYRTMVGSDVWGSDRHYKLHLIYNALATPSEITYETLDDSPDASIFSWDIQTTPIEVSGYQHTSYLVVDSTKTNAYTLWVLEDILYGNDTNEPRLPYPDEVLSIIEDNQQAVLLTEDESILLTEDNQAILIEGGA